MKKRSTRREALQCLAAAAGTGFGPLKARAQGTEFQVAGRPVELALTPAGVHTVRVTVRGLENGRPQAIPQDGALVKEDWGPPSALLRSLDGPRTVKCGGFIIKTSPNPLTIEVSSRTGRPIQMLRLDSSTGVLSFRTGEGPLLGLGAGGPQFDRRGDADRMVSGQGGYHLGTHGGRVPIQLLIGTSGWAIFIHHPLGTFDLTGQEGNLKSANPESALPLDLFVIGAPDPPSILKEYAKITGFAEMPPLWSLGYQQSHRTLGSPDDILAEAAKFRERKLPCDAMIYLGTDFCPVGWNTHNGEFTWNPKPFPDPAQAVEQLHNEHFKVVLHIVVEGHRFTGTVTDPCTAPALPSGRTPDQKWPPDRQVSCYWPAHKPLVDLGVDGWWPDQGDGYDAPSRLARNRMYFEGQQMYRPNERVYALHRNGYAGMQRYASFLWSGDVQSTWRTLAAHVPVAINAGLSGIPYWGTDIGGFIPTADLTGELYVRWFQFAAFCPLFRSHGRIWTLRLPWGWNMGEPSALVREETPRYHVDANEFHNAAVEPICKKYLELRYRLIPYLYSAVKETCESGLPILRAMWLHYPADAAAAARGDQYLFGRDILVSPVVEKGAASRSVYLPKGLWYDFWTRERIEGGREITRKVDLETIPLYARAGALIPMGPVKQYTGETVDAPMDLWVHPGADGNFSLYEDDGHTFNYRKGEFTRIDITWMDRRRRLTLRPGKGSRIAEPVKRRMIVRVAGESTARDLIFTGRPIEMRL